MRTAKILAAFIAVIAAIGLFAGAAHADSADNPNEVTYWQNQYPGMTCYKNTWPGQLSADGYAVQLVDSVGKVVIVNGGSNNAVYENAVVGVDYYPPLNNGGQHPLVSHWIICKGKIPEQTTTTTVVEDTTTTSTVAESTTTTAPADTTTTAPAATTTTVDMCVWPNGICGPAQSDTTFTPNVAVDVPPTAPPSTPLAAPVGPVLPSTGNNGAWTIALIAAVLLLVGIVLVNRSRRL